MLRHTVLSVSLHVHTHPTALYLLFVRCVVLKYRPLLANPNHPDIPRDIPALAKKLMGARPTASPPTLGSRGLGTPVLR